MRNNATDGRTITSPVARWTVMSVASILVTLATVGCSTSPAPSVEAEGTATPVPAANCDKPVQPSNLPTATAEPSLTVLPPVTIEIPLIEDSFPQEYCANVLLGQEVSIKIENQTGVASTIRVPELGLEKPIAANELSELTFSADRTGLFELVAENPHRHLSWIRVR